ERTQRVAQECESSGGHRRVNSAVHLLRVDTGGEQLAGNGVCARSRVAEPKAAGVGEDRGVQSGCDWLRELEPNNRREIEDELARSAGRRVGKHHIAS